MFHLHMDALPDVDLGRYVQQIGQLLANADPWVLGIAVSVLVGIGHKLAIGNRLVYGWGLRLGALAFLGYLGWGVGQTGTFEQVLAPGVLARAGILGGAVLAVIWILLPIILFIYGYFRYGLAGFVGYAGYALLTTETITTEAVPGVALRGLLVAGLAMVLAWIFKPVFDFVGTLWLAWKPAAPTVAAAPAGAVAGSALAAPGEAAPPVIPVAEKAVLAATEPRLARLERRQRRLARLQARQTKLAQKTMLASPAQPASASTAEPLEAEGDSRRRREKARLEVELAYLLASAQLGTSFPRPIFDGWVARYLRDQLPVSEVEENSWQMQKALRQYHPQADASPTNINLEDLHVWFLEEQRKIQAQQLDVAIRQANLLSLQELYVSLSQRLLTEPAGAVVQMIRPQPPEKLSLPDAIAAR